MPGGRSQPVAQGEKPRAIRPLGATRKAKPMAMGDMRRRQKRWQRRAQDLGRRGVPTLVAHSAIARISEMRLAPKPTEIVSHSAERKTCIGEELAPGIEREIARTQHRQIAEGGKSVQSSPAPIRREAGSAGSGPARDAASDQRAVRASQSPTIRVIQEGCGSSSTSAISSGPGMAGCCDVCANSARASASSLSVSSTVKAPSTVGSCASRLSLRRHQEISRRPSHLSCSRHL